jgi:rubrerythrin
VGVIEKLKKMLFRKPKRRYGPTLHMDLCNPREWITDSNIFECKRCGTTTLSDDYWMVCSSCGAAMEKEGEMTVRELKEEKVHIECQD